MTADRRLVVAVTGASSGVGRASVQAFARKGAAVGLIARGTDALRATEAEVVSLGGRALAAPADVADPQAVERRPRDEAELGPIDVWVNNAMTSVFAPAHEIRPEEFARVTEVTYLGTVYGTLSALSRMRPREARRDRPGRLGARIPWDPVAERLLRRKARDPGVHGIAAGELMHEHSRVRVTMVQLPAMNTPQFDVVRTGCPDTRSRSRRSISPRSRRCVVAAAARPQRLERGGSAPPRRSR